MHICKHTHTYIACEQALLRGGGRGVVEEGKESLHASYCSSNSAPKTRGARSVKSYQRTPEMSDKLTYKKKCLPALRKKCVVEGESLKRSM